MFQEIVDRYSPYGFKLDAAGLPVVAYHYTDAGGLVGMLSSDAIWASEYRFLNDRSEVQHTLAIVRSLLLKRTDRQCANDLRKLCAKILQELDKPQDTEVCVFSLSEDGDSLSQWRGYAHDGQGFTLGFDVNALVRAGEADDAVFCFSKVEYDATKQQLGLSKALEEVEREFTKRIADGQSRAHVITAAANAFDLITWNRAVNNKHVSFESEREWRISSFSNAAEMKVRARQNGLAPYLELTAKELCGLEKLPLREIGIGPGFSLQDQLPAVKALCRQYGYKPRIYSASAPYRSL
jgi:hypothetical protein